MCAGFWVTLRGEFALWFYSTCLFHSAEHGAEAKFEEHHDPEVPEGGRRECYQCSRQTAAGGVYLQRQGELMQLQGFKIKLTKDIVGSWHPKYGRFLCMLSACCASSDSRQGWVRCPAWAMQLAELHVVISELHAQYHWGSNIWITPRVNWCCHSHFYFPLQSSGEIANIFH